MFPWTMPQKVRPLVANRNSSYCAKRTRLRTKKHPCAPVPREVRSGAPIKVPATLTTFPPSLLATVLMQREKVRGGNKRAAPKKCVTWRGSYSEGESLEFFDTTKPAPSLTSTGAAVSAHRTGSPRDEITFHPSTPRESSSSLYFIFTAPPPIPGTGAPSKQTWFRRSVLSLEAVNADPVSDPLDCYKNCTDSPSRSGSPPLTASTGATNEGMRERYPQGFLKKSGASISVHKCWPSRSGTGLHTSSRST